MQNSVFLYGILFVWLLASCSLPNKGLTQEFPSVQYDIITSSKKVEVDKVQRIYVVTSDNAIVHYGKERLELFRYANRRSGIITDLNVSNPIKILVYYRDFGNVILLDNTLTLIQEFNIVDLGYTDISAVGVSNDDAYWIFDPLRFRLLKIKINGDILYESANVHDFGITKPIITKIVESGNTVILLDPDKGFYIFDNFGQFIRYVPAQNIASFQFDGSNITYFTPSGLHFFTIENFDPVLITLKESINFSKIKDLVYLNSEYIMVYPEGLKIVPIQK